LEKETPVTYEEAMLLE